MLLAGVFPKSECKGIDFSNTLQIFSGLFFKNASKLMYVKQEGRYGSHMRHDLITDMTRSYHGRGRILSHTRIVTQAWQDLITDVARSSRWTSGYSW